MGMLYLYYLNEFEASMYSQLHLTISHHWNFHILYALPGTSREQRVAATGGDVAEGEGHTNVFQNSMGETWRNK